MPEASIWTSALATATFLDSQRPGGSAYVVGEPGLTTALHDVGYVRTGISTRNSVERLPYRPSLVLDSVAELV